MEGLLPPTGIDPTPFQNSVSKVAGLQVHATTPGLLSKWKLWLLLETEECIHRVVLLDTLYQSKLYLMGHRH